MKAKKIAGTDFRPLVDDYIAKEQMVTALESSGAAAELIEKAIAEQNAAFERMRRYQPKS